MSKVIDINGILEARRIAINSKRVAEKMIEKQKADDSEAKRLCGTIALQGWLDAGNGRQDEPA